MPTIAEDFDRFWREFPRKTAKLDAKKAYDKARKLATADEILKGVAGYVAHKPDYADWCHPATFLNKGRWLDEYDEPKAQATATDWWEDCKALHNGECTKRWDHEMKMRERA